MLSCTGGVYAIAATIAGLQARTPEGQRRMRLTLNLVVGFGLYWVGRQATSGFGLSHLAVALATSSLGIVLQLTYARLLTNHFTAIGMSDIERNRLPNDSGVAPFWLQSVGFLARSSLLAGTILPILHALRVLK